MEEEEEEEESVWSTGVGTTLKVMKPMRMTTSETSRVQRTEEKDIFHYVK